MVQAIPFSLSSAMLAGVLLNICLIPVTSLVQAPMVIGPVILAWFLVSLVSKLWALPAALLAGGMVSYLGGFVPAQIQWQLTQWVWVMPEFFWISSVGIALPLFLVTMSSQNLAGMAVLKANGYRPDLSSALRWTGGLSILAAPAGSHQINLAALTAAMCANPDVDRDPKLRYGSAVAAGAVYLVMGWLCT